MRLSKIHHIGWHIAYNEVLGITIWYSDFYHDDIFVSQCPSSNNASRCVVFRSIIANNGTGVTLANATSQTLQYYPIPDGSVTLSIKGEDVRYSFGYSTSDDDITWVGSVDSIWLFTAPPGLVSDILEIGVSALIILAGIFFSKARNLGCILRVGKRHP